MATPTPLTPDTCTRPGGIHFPHIVLWDRGKDAMEMDDNDLGHLTQGLELVNDLHHSRLVLDDHNLTSEGDEMHEALPHSSSIAPISAGAGQEGVLTGRGGRNFHGALFLGFWRHADQIVCHNMRQVSTHDANYRPIYSELASERKNRVRVSHADF